MHVCTLVPESSCSPAVGALRQDPSLPSPRHVDMVDLLFICLFFFLVQWHLGLPPVRGSV